MWVQNLAYISNIKPNIQVNLYGDDASAYRIGEGCIPNKYA